jgi:hypothetical protein
LKQYSSVEILYGNDTRDSEPAAAPPGKPFVQIEFARAPFFA